MPEQERQPDVQDGEVKVTGTDEKPGVTIGAPPAVADSRPDELREKDEDA